MNKANVEIATGIASRSSIGIAIGNSIGIAARGGGRKTKTKEENTQRTKHTERGKEKKKQRGTRGVDTLR